LQAAPDGRVVAVRAACPTGAVFVRRARCGDDARLYRRAMNQFPESAFEDAGEGPSFLSRVGIALALLTAGIGIALFLAAA